MPPIPHCYSSLSSQSAFVTITRDFSSANTNCSDNIARSWDAINRVAEDGKCHTPAYQLLLLLPDIGWLTTTFRLCSPLTSGQLDDFQSWIVNTWFNLAMGI